MKNYISMIAITMAMATPAFADKTPVKPVQSYTCATDSKFEWIVAYQLDQIEIAIKEMRQNIQRHPHPKPKDNFKKAG